MDSPQGTEPPDGTGPKRRRRRRRGPRNSDSSGDQKSSDSKPEAQDASGPQASGRAGGQRSEGDRKSGNRRGRGKRPPANRAAKVLSKRPESIDLDKNVEEPLSKQEIAAFREHFRFLRVHRKDLRLKVNANEDLLLNRVREPLHRGVCLHLLGKVERKSVLATVKRLDAAKGATFLAGVIRFSSDIEYVLLFLEKINESSSSAEATAALFQGFQRIDFNKVSSAQMRRVLQLITELFDSKERPALLLGMLESPGFRDAFDKSMSDLPEVLAQLVIPLRAAQAVLLHGHSNTFDSEVLRDGVILLLSMESKILLRLSAAARGRLFDFGLQSCSAPHHQLHDLLKMLLRNFAASDSKSSERGIALARHLITANADNDARQILEALAKGHSEAKIANRWLAFLKADRIGRIVLLEQPADANGALGSGTRRPGIWLETMGPVSVQFADAEKSASHQETAALMSELCIPGVATVLESGTTPTGEPYFALSGAGKSLDRALRENSGLELFPTLRVCHEAVAILSALSAVGVQLPDTSLQRFTLEVSGALLLTDLNGANRVTPESDGGFHSELARSFCNEVLGLARRHILPAQVRTVVSDSKSCAELARGLARSRG